MANVLYPGIMTTYYNGLDVPKTQIDVFTVSTDISGDYTFGLLYDPKPSIHQIAIVAKLFVNNRPIVGVAQGLAGKRITVRFFETYYDKTNTPTATDDGSTGGVPTHSHALAYTSTRMTATPICLEAVGCTIIYEPTGGS